jgi:hypothetical protein
MDKGIQLSSSLENVRELEAFAFDLLGKLTSEKLRHGDDLAPYAERLGVRIPEALRDVELTWDSARESEAELADGDTLVLVRPGRPQAVGLTIGCARFGRFRVCLECGFFWCRIVIKGRF